MNRKGWWTGILVLLSIVSCPVNAHEHTFPAGFAHLARASQANGGVKGEGAEAERDCALRVRLRDATSKEPLYGLIRVSGPDGPLFIEGLQERPAGWFSMPPDAEFEVPHGNLRVEAVHGTDTLVHSEKVILSAGSRADLSFDLTRFYNPSEHRIYAGNTHLHLRVNARENIGFLLRDRADADAYLQTTGNSDGIDLVYVSYLTRPGESASYVSNEYDDDAFATLTQGTTRFAGGIEHRHAGIRAEIHGYRGTPSRIGRTTVMAYGHVMLLGLRNREIPASIGPGLSDDPQATDGVALRDGIIAAREQGAHAIWCHGTQGLENVPDWISGLLHAQNIYDGGNLGSFDTVFYPLLNAGYRVPFSTGTDWGVFDFSRVYVPSDDGFTSDVFLRQLAAGRSFITNEPFLEFTVNGAGPGDTVSLAAPGTVRVRGRAIGRSDFVRIQLIRNGRIVGEAQSREVDGHFEAGLELEVPAEESGWMALRIQPARDYDIHATESGPGANLFGRTIFAHTSAVYIDIAGRPVFDAGSVEHLLARVREARDATDRFGSYGSTGEYDRIQQIYTDAEAALQLRLIQSSTR